MIAARHAVTVSNIAIQVFCNMHMHGRRLVRPYAIVKANALVFN